jgi:hypothetical protein
MSRAPHYTVFGDFVSFECCRLDAALARTTVSGVVTWKAVQTDPSLPVPTRPLDRRVADALADEIAIATRDDPALRVTPPRIRPNSLRATIALASVALHAPPRVAAFRHAVFATYWQSGGDIAAPAVLLAAADLAQVPRHVDLDHPDADDIVSDWETDWVMERLGGVPRVIRDDGRILWKATSLVEISDFFRVPM